MNKNSLQLGDLLRLEGLSKPGKVELSCSVRSEYQALISEVAAKIESNLDFTAGDALALAKITEKMGVVDYFGDAMSMEEFSAIEDRAKNSEACRILMEVLERFVGQPIQVGDFTVDISYLPLRIAEALTRNAANVLNFPKLKKLRPEVARELVKTEKTHIKLTGLEELPVEVAQEFAVHQGCLVLDIVDASLETLAELAKHQGSLKLNKLILDKEKAEVLSTCKASALELNCWEKPDVEVARELAKFENKLILDFLQVDRDMARELANFSGPCLALRGSADFMDDEVAKYLSKSKAKELWFGCIDLYVGKAVGWMAQYEGNLVVSGEFLHDIHKYKTHLNYGR